MSNIITDRWLPHDEDVAFPCPCGHYATAKFCLPEVNGKVAIFGTCENCYRNGDNPTTIMYLDLDRKDWLELVSDPNSFVVRRER